MSRREDDRSLGPGLVASCEAAGGASVVRRACMYACLPSCRCRGGAERNGYARAACNAVRRGLASINPSSFFAGTLLMSGRVAFAVARGIAECMSCEGMLVRCHLWSEEHVGVYTAALLHACMRRCPPAETGMRGMDARMGGSGGVESLFSRACGACLLRELPSSNARARARARFVKPPRDKHQGEKKIQGRKENTSENSPLGTTHTPPLEIAN